MNMALLFFMANFNYFYVIDNTRIYICFAVLAYFMYVDIVEKSTVFSAFSYMRLCVISLRHIAVCAYKNSASAYQKDIADCEKGFYYNTSGAYFAANKIAIALGSASDGLLGTVEKKVSGYSNYEVFGIWQFSMSIIRLVWLLL